MCTKKILETRFTSNGYTGMQLTVSSKSLTVTRGNVSRRRNDGRANTPTVVITTVFSILFTYSISGAVTGTVPFLFSRGVFVRKPVSTTFTRSIRHPDVSFSRTFPAHTGRVQRHRRAPRDSAVRHTYTTLSCANTTLPVQDPVVDPGQEGGHGRTFSLP